MNPNHFENLTDRARAGDTAAVASLHAELQPVLQRMARRALRAQGPTNPLTVRLRDEARRVQADHARTAHDRDGLLRRVAQRVCQGFVQRLQPRPGAIVAGRETVLEF